MRSKYRLIFLSFFCVLAFFSMQQASFAKTGNLIGIEKKAAVHKLDPKIFRLALNAQSKAKARGEIKNSHILTVIDYSKPSTEKRMWVIDLQRNVILHHTYVAHGQGTGLKTAQHFSNIPGSHQSSLGVFKTGATYMGNHGYSLNIHGLEHGFNTNAFQRRIVVHGAHYVGEKVIKSMGRLGRSHGCPAVPQHQARSIIQSMQSGTLIFAYYPDKTWLKKSKYIA